MQTFRLPLDDGHHLVGDELEGARPYYLFLHGLGSVRAGEKSATLMEHAARRGHGCLRFDMRGHGESSGQLGRVKLTELVDDAVRILERIGPAFVVGSSLGGLVASHAAAARPDLFRRLALLAPAFGMMPALEQLLDARGCLRTDQGLEFHVAQEVIADAKRHDERALPQRITCPTLVVHGTADDVVPVAVSEHLHAALAAKVRQLWIVADGDHRLSAVAPEIWRRLDDLPLPEEAGR